MRIIVGISFVVVALIAWFFLISSYFLPKSYSDCLKTHTYTNNYTRDDLFCTFSPGTPAQQRLCEKKDGIINQFKQCIIAYYNPDFIFPKNLAECGSKVGFIDTNKTVCDIQIDNKGAYDSVIVNNLLEKCIQNGGQKIFENSCWIRFTSQGIKF
ncbi:MAG TPA: hypothetical protein PLU63_01825 [Candidatus Woesebacteria bacterium]|nr:hypothetical protein [Candidatus Woesebacteria bacterium]